MHRFFLSLLVLPVLAVVAAGCGTTLYQPGGALRFDPTAGTQVTEDDIRLAFEARPQMVTPSRVAVYSLDPERGNEVRAMVEGLDGVEDVYPISRLLVTGQRRYDDQPMEPERLDVRDLRLISARAQCDLLVVVDHGYRIRRRANGLVAFNVLILPVLFVPFMDAEVESYLDAYVIDVRNGFLYGHVTSDEDGQRRRLTAWSEADQRLANEQWSALLDATRETLSQVIGAGAGREPPADSPAGEADPPTGGV